MIHHGPDYLLMRGYGVCQSYAIAYKMLLESKGISVDYVDSDLIGHGWNAVKIDGEWYHVDTTWDTIGYAPYDQGEPSDHNHHIYFMLPDRIVTTLPNQHVGHDPKYAEMCVSMAANYYVRSGLADPWVENAEESMAIVYETETVTASTSIQSYLEMYSDRYGFWVPQAVCAAAVAEILNGQERIAEDGAAYALAATSEGAMLSVTATRVKESYEGLDTLVLPADLVTIDEGALMNTGAEVIIIPEGCTQIGEDAFADCSNLKYIVNRSELEIIAPEGVEVIVE